MNLTLPAGGKSFHPHPSRRCRWTRWCVLGSWGSSLSEVNNHKMTCQSNQHSTAW